MEFEDIKSGIKYKRGSTSIFGKAISKTSLLEDLIKSKKDFTKEEVKAKKIEDELLRYLNSRKDRSVLQLKLEKIFTDPLTYLLIAGVGFFILLILI